MTDGMGARAVTLSRNVEVIDTLDDNIDYDYKGYQIIKGDLNYEQDMVLYDEVVLSSISEGSKVVLIGDTQGQTYGVNRANEGFKVLYKHLGKAPEFNFIKLENIYRSKLAKFVEEIFERFMLLKEILLFQKVKSLKVLKKS